MYLFVFLEHGNRSPRANLDVAKMSRKMRARFPMRDGKLSQLHPRASHSLFRSLFAGRRLGAAFKTRRKDAEYR